MAILLIGGDKTGQAEFYGRMLRQADRSTMNIWPNLKRRARRGNEAMGGRHSFDRLRAALPADHRARADALTERMDRDLSLTELRRARAMTQDQLAADLHVGQASIAKLERRTDMYLSTLRRFVEAMGGKLEIVATFPDQQVRLRGIGELHEAKEATTPGIRP